MCLVHCGESHIPGEKLSCPLEGMAVLRLMIFTTQCIISACVSLNYIQTFLTQCKQTYPDSIGTDLPIVVGTSPVECQSSSELDERYTFTQNGCK